MHCVFMPNSQFCQLLMAQYPFSLSHSALVFSLSFFLSLQFLFLKFSMLHIGDSYVIVVCYIFNPVCTYHAGAPPGSEQERLEYAVTCKRRVLNLALRWAAVHTHHLQEEPAALIFLEVHTHTHTHTHPRSCLSLCVSLCRSCMGVCPMTHGSSELWKTLYLTWRRLSNYSM